MDPSQELLIAHTLRGGGFDASEDGTGRGTPIIPILEVGKREGHGECGLGIGRAGDPMSTLQRGAQHGVCIPFDTTQITSAENRANPSPGDPSHPLSRSGHPPALAFHGTQDPDPSGDITHPLGRNHGAEASMMIGARVRRITPLEAERLQGFPDGYTAIPGAKDGPRYAAIGNSMAVPCMKWLGERISAVDRISNG